MTFLARFFRSERGVVSVEAAFAYPALIIVILMVMEVANMALTIEIGENAVSRSLIQFREAGTLSDSAANDIRYAIAAKSLGFIRPSDVKLVSVEPYETLDAMGSEGGGAAEKGDDDAEDEGSAIEDLQNPAWRVVVSVRKDFITPLPRMLPSDRKDFGFRYERVLSYLPAVEEADGV